MNKFSKYLLGFLVIIVPILLLLGLLFSNLSKRSFYPSTGEEKVSGIKSQVDVYFDDYGVPHIFAHNEEDAYFTLGYMHARDRLWQMDVTRRLAEGRLSEIFGISTIEFDKLFRTIGINRFCYNWFGNISPKSKQILESYTKGVNQFIETHYDNLPVEFDALNYRPEPWKPENSLMIARLMGWELNISWYTDYILGEIINKVGIERASEIFPDSNIVLFKKPAEDTVKSEKENASIESLRKLAVLGNEFFMSNQDYRKFFGINGSHTGSNSWVVSGSKSAYGKPILANDPHLALQAPSKWYEAYIKGGELEATGMTIAGVPGVVIGNNRFISWGVTNLMNDDTDFRILTKDSTDERKYLYRKSSYFPDSLIENIFVKDSLNEIRFVVRVTKEGPVISNLGLRGFADIKNSNENIYKDKLLTFRWTGFEQSDEVLCFYNINTAKTWDDFKTGLRDLNVPAMNFMYADINGNIGYHAAGKIPLRKTGDFKSYIYPSTDEADWTGFADFNELPSQFNPKEGFIVTANTNPFEWLKTEPKNRFYISYLWESSSRFDKLQEFLNSRMYFDIEDFNLLQNSVESPFDRTIAKYIPEAFKDQNIQDENIKWCVERFANWNGELNASESIGLVYNTFLVFLLKNVFEDELGINVLHDFFVIQNLPYRAIEKLLKENTTAWFDNINTPFIEKRDLIVRKSLADAIEFLKPQFENKDINTWHWGILHKVKFKHPLGSVEELDKSFNIGPFDIGGDQTTPNNTEFQFNNVLEQGDYSVLVGSSMRMIVNMADIEHSYTINSTGQSGQPVHPNYHDQSRKWLYGEYKTNTMNRFEMIHQDYDLLMLIPAF